MELNYLAILVCGIAAIIIGSIWHGPLFGKIWMRDVMGAATMSPEQSAAMKKGMWVYYLLQFISFTHNSRKCYLYILLIGSDPSKSAVWIAVCTWFGFVMTTAAGAALWSGKPKNVAWKMFLISAGGYLVTFIAFGLILEMWM
jgi:hypothetical protein